jgi:hypothetical protein
MSFREQIQNIQDGIEDLDILMEAEQNARAALYEKYEKRGILLAAYHLWEDGHCQGDASDEEMTNDAIALGIDVTKEDWEQRLLDKLDEEYLGFYAIELEEVA